MEDKKILFLEEKIKKFPRVKLAHTPTPLDEAPRISKVLGIDLLIKREDCTGLAFGGNYSRMSELTLGDAVANGADTVIHGASSQSNHCRQLAAASAKLGLNCYLVVKRDEFAKRTLGNLFLDGLFGAHVEIVDAELGDGIEAKKAELFERLKVERPDLKPYLMRKEVYGPLATIASVECCLETERQLRTMGRRPDFVYLASCGANQAGFIIGRDFLGNHEQIVGISPIKWESAEIIKRCIDSASEKLGIQNHTQLEDITCLYDYLGGGYGEVTDAGQEAIRLLARNEGVILDPVYTGKAMAGLIDHVRTGTVPKGSTVLFVHTGGTPVLLAYSDRLDNVVNE